MIEVVVTTGAVSHAKLQNIAITNNQHPAFYRPDALPVAQPTMSKHLMEKYHIPWTCLPQAHLGSSGFVSDHK